VPSASSLAFKWSYTWGLQRSWQWGVYLPVCLGGCVGVWVCGVCAREVLLKSRDPHLACGGKKKEWRTAQKRKSGRNVKGKKGRLSTPRNCLRGGPALVNDDIQSMCLCVYAQCSLMFASVIPVTKTKAQWPVGCPIMLPNPDSRLMGCDTPSRNTWYVVKLDNDSAFETTQCSTVRH